MRIAKLMAATAIAAATLVGPALAATKVTFWQFSTREADIASWKAAIAEFEKANPDITVEMELVPWSEQQQRLVSALSTGGLPDVSMLGNNVVAQFQAAGALAPLDDYFAAYDKEHGTNVASEIWPGDKGYYNIAGHWWASPIAVETRALYYRKDLFKAAGLDPDKPPQTWADFAADADKLTKANKDGIYGAALPMSLDYATVQNFMAAYLGYGARMLGDDHKCGFDTPEFTAALDVYTSVYKDKATHPDAPTMNGDVFRKGFRDGKFAMILSDPGFYTDLKTDNQPFLGDIGIAMVPAGPKNRSGFLGGWPLVLWNASENKDAAAKWIMFATHGEPLRHLAQVAGAIPGSTALARTAPWTDYPYPLFVQQLSDARPYQYPSDAIPQMGQLEVDTIQKAVQAVALGRQSADEATKQLCTTINDVLSR
ncbi:ABC transporter substrate-binding protein [Labrys wisconsinensis]|uniref:ABC-type glycerol-3-phosphate transport system substrate-binding protein n=1 Tax=Labrys wisconsinensis TaxID=425677 RepID=A0ABU0JEK8_9HYPH|nr:sugar ABC transporter substrate-binding protein [Labrys wisconsinensis]MDQ0472050.1 ABC-type glycerol-3-phosphate transport system substrate-binding protein [Labrys wisconsinensis]